MQRSNTDKRRDRNRRGTGTLPFSGPAERAAALAAAILVWTCIARFVHTGILIPSPGEVLIRFPALMAGPDFMSAVIFSTGRIAAGFFFAFLAGIVLAACASAFPAVRTLLWPYIAVVRAVPVASFIIMALIWIRAENLSVFITFLMVFPIIYQNTLAGFDSEDPLLREMADSFHVPMPVRLRYIDLPRLRPWIRSACSSGIGFAWKSGVAAEIIGLPKGSIGEMVYNAKIYFETADLFCWTISIVLLNLVTGHLFLWAADLLFAAVSPDCGMGRGPHGQSRDAERTGPKNSTSLSENAAGANVRLEHIRFAYENEPPVLNDLSLTIPAGSHMSLMGPSGEGKTTLLRIISGLQRPDSGTVTRQMPDSSDGLVAFLFQEDRLLPDLSARANIRFVLRPGGQTAVSASSEDDLIDSLLTSLLLTPEDARKPVRELSGGMQRRVAIARTLAYGGNLILLDEPFKGLDEKTRDTVIRFVRDYTQDRTVLMITHEKAEAELFGGTVLRL